MMWASQGKKRPQNNDDLFADIEMINGFAKQYKFVRVFCFEPEQMLLCQEFERRLLALYDKAMPQLKKQLNAAHLNKV
jgi:hypothetical protein